MHLSALKMLFAHKYGKTEQHCTCEGTYNSAVRQYKLLFSELT